MSRVALAFIAFTLCGCDLLWGPRAIDGKPCGANHACPEGFACGGDDKCSELGGGVADGAFCGVACAGDGDCPSNAPHCDTAHTVSAGGPGACTSLASSSCASDEECTASLGTAQGRCLNQTVCTPACTADSDCGTPGHCDPRGYCQFVCVVDADCSDALGGPACFDIGIAGNFPELIGLNACGCNVDADCGRVPAPSGDRCFDHICGCSGDAVCTGAGKTCIARTP